MRFAFACVLSIAVAGCGEPGGRDATPDKPGGTTPAAGDGKLSKEQLAAIDKRMQDAGANCYEYPQLLVPGSIRVYEIQGTKTQAVLAHLPEPGVAWGLRLEHPSLTADGLKAIKPSPNLKYINVSHRPVGDDGMDALKKHSNVEELHAISSNVTDAGLVHVKAFSKLRRTDLGHNPITDKGLAELAGLRDLTDITLGFTQVTDAGMKYVGAMKNLTVLHIGATAITDAGLKPLYGLKKLNTLHLPFHVTDDGVKRLQAALPNCKIHR